MASKVFFVFLSPPLFECFNGVFLTVIFAEIFRAFLYKGFLSEEECDHLIKLVRVKEKINL